MVILNSAIKRALLHFNLEIRRLSTRVGHDPLVDAKNIFREKKNCIIFDVGANRGQTVVKLQKLFKAPRIHAFEPSPTTFQEMKKNLAASDQLFLNNSALRNQSGTLDFIENTDSDMSSFLQPSQSSWGQVKKVIPVKSLTLDDYCAQENIDHIDFLKIDTQGCDHHVLLGAQNFLRQGKIKAILTEIIFSDMYQDIPRFDKTYALLADSNFRLVSFYQQYYQNDLISWTDALFVRN